MTGPIKIQSAARWDSIRIEAKKKIGLHRQSLCLVQADVIEKVKTH